MSNQLESVQRQAREESHNLPDFFLPFIHLMIFIIGLCFGSFLNVIIYRLPKKLSLVQPPSSCPACNYRLGVIELIPLLGYLMLKGRCRKCGVKISSRYPTVELSTGLLFLLLFLNFNMSADFLFYLALLFILLAVSLIDLEYRIVPNRLVAAGLIVAALFYLPKIFNYIFNLPEYLLVNIDLPDALFGLVSGGGIMLLIFLISRGGMGAGDVKLMAMIGFFVGLRGTAVVFLFGFAFGALVGVAFMVSCRLTRKDALPFGPFLSLAALVEVLWGSRLWDWYVNLLN